MKCINFTYILAARLMESSELVSQLRQELQVCCVQ